MEQIVLPKEGLDLPKFLSAIEDSYIEQALMKADGNVTKAAELLGLGRTTLREKLRRKGRTTPTEPVVDPEGEFTFKKLDDGYHIFYKGELVETKRTIQSVNAFIKEKIRE